MLLFNSRQESFIPSQMNDGNTDILVGLYGLEACLEWVFLLLQIVDLVKQGHYQLACGRHFEIRNNLDVKFVPQHPNQYFEDSQRVIQGFKPTGGNILFQLQFYNPLRNSNVV